MSDPFSRRRYLIDFETQRLGQVFTDVLVIGGGVAGLRSAIEAARHVNVVLVTKDRLTESATAWAQGGIAVVQDEHDSVEAHVEDTLRVGCGLCDRAAVEIMAGEGPARLEELIHWGAQFDLEHGAVALGLEGGHSARRVVHAKGDATGQELARTLADRTISSGRVRVFQNCFVIDLVVEEGRCVAALTHHEKYGHQIIWARSTILATGGAGCLYRETTNPPGATADGHAAAFRAGASLRDMEFMQFHPTALYVAGAARALISEAVRGEGGKLVDREGRRFMPEYHSDGELAPRDVVSRAIVDHIAKTGATCAYLDVRHFPRGGFEERFPNIATLCQHFDIDVGRDLIPVRPAAHYMIGGVKTDEWGRSDVAGLFACGEASSSGVHGANRLASNSLIEGLVYGRRAGQCAAEATDAPSGPRSIRHEEPPSSRTVLDLPDVRNSLRAMCWRNLGIDRQGERLRETIEILEFWGRYVMDKVLEDRAGWEVQNLLTGAWCLARSALLREESRGVHFRGDYPDGNDGKFLGHVVIRRGVEGVAARLESV